MKSYNSTEHQLEWDTCLPETCQGRCGYSYKSYTLNNLLRCTCDTQCLHLGDCCFDFAIECPEYLPKIIHETVPSVSRKLLRADSNRAAKYLIDVALRFSELHNSTVHNQHCTKTSINFYSRVNLNCSSNCTSPKENEACQTGKTSYVANGFKVYKNLNCALCNGESIDNLQPIAVKLKCGNGNENSQKLISMFWEMEFSDFSHIHTGQKSARNASTRCKR